MKRFTLVLAVFLGFTAAMNAQTYVGEISGYFNIMPGYFTSSGHPYVIRFVDNGDYDQYLSVYQSDFTTHITDIGMDVYANTSSVRFLDLDASPDQTTVWFSNFPADRAITFTQTLFNDDEHFEYFETERGLVTHYDTVYHEDGTFEAFEWTSDATVAIRIKSTNGSTVWSYDAGENSSCEIMGLFKLDNKFFLCINGGNSQLKLYLIQQNQGLAKVETPLPISVFPSIVDRNQQITVELGEGNNATEITVVNSLGQVIKRVPVQEGQRQITIPAQNLNSGLNVVNTRTNQGQGSCKIIVR